MSLRPLVTAAALLALGGCNPPHLGWDPDLSWDTEGEEPDAPPALPEPSAPFLPTGIVGGRALVDLEGRALRQPPLPFEVRGSSPRLLAWHFASLRVGAAYLRDASGALVLRWEGEGYRTLRRFSAPPFAPGLVDGREEDLRHLARAWEDGTLLVAGARTQPGGATTVWAFVDVPGSPPREYAFDLPAANLHPAAGGVLTLVGAATPYELTGVASVPALGARSALSFLTIDLRRGAATATAVANATGAFAARGFNAADDYFVLAEDLPASGPPPASAWRYCRAQACGTRPSGAPLLLSTPQVGLLGVQAGESAALRIADVRSSDPVERTIALPGAGAPLRPMAVAADPRDRQALLIYAEDALAYGGEWAVFRYHLDEHTVRSIGRVEPFRGPASLARATSPAASLPAGPDFYFPAR